MYLSFTKLQLLEALTMPIINYYGSDLLTTNSIYYN